MLEVQLGELAKNKATRQDVKEFGGMMATDHGQANEELKALARAKGVTLDDKLDTKHSAMLDKLSRIDPEKFDDAYIEDMIADHKKDSADFEETARSTKDAELKAFTVKTGGLINTHLERITAIQKAPHQP
jgi:putative membrane protein